MLDRVGRVQLPRDFVSALQLKRRVRLELEPDHVGVWPDRSAGGSSTDSASWRTPHKPGEYDPYEAPSTTTSRAADKRDDDEVAW